MDNTKILSSYAPFPENQTSKAAALLINLIFPSRVRTDIAVDFTIDHDVPPNVVYCPDCILKSSMGLSNTTWFVSDPQASIF